jgi:8-oxo-dGTP pyrophosphatase MutT (NUDIX family)
MHGNSGSKLSKWNKVSEKRVGDYGIFETRLCRFENTDSGKSGNFYTIGCCDWVNVIAETDDDRIVIVEQYRFGLEDFSLELPGGMMERGESAIAAAARELEEETGFCGDGAELIAVMYPNPAIQTNRLNVVLIKNCRRVKPTHFDEFEDLRSSTATLNELIDLVGSGKISHCIAVATIAKYMLLRGRA